jgi:hypothetical protein
MTPPTVAPVAVIAPVEHGVEVVHFWCCDQTRAWCGEDIAGTQYCPDGCGCPECVVCEDLLDAPCPYGCDA